MTKDATSSPEGERGSVPNKANKECPAPKEDAGIISSSSLPHTTTGEMPICEMVKKDYCTPNHKQRKRNANGNHKLKAAWEWWQRMQNV